MVLQGHGGDEKDEVPAGKWSMGREEGRFFTGERTFSKPGCKYGRNLAVAAFTLGDLFLFLFLGVPP